MATISKGWVLGQIIKRNLSQASPKARSEASTRIETCTHPNKLVVAAIESDQPIAKIAVVVKSGSRYETPENAGVSHVLRVSAGLKTENATSFYIQRSLEKIGVNLSATGDRETVTYTIEGTRDVIGEAIKTLAEVVARPLFRPWEVEDNLPRLKYELAGLSPQVRVIDMLHTAAYRRGLGNSLFCPKRHVGKISSETLQHFVKSSLAGGNIAVAGVGVNVAQLNQLAQSLQASADSAATPTPSKYSGGELRKEKAGPLAYVAIATEGASLKNTKEALACAVVQRALGIGPQVKWGSSPSPLWQAVEKAANGQPFAVSALNASYSDSGLVGVVLAAPTRAAGDVVKAAVRVLKSGVSDAKVIERAKKQLKVAVLSSAEETDGLLTEIAQQAALLGTVQDAASVARAIDEISAADVRQVVEKISRGKPSLAAIGNLATVPYIDEL